MTIRLITLLLLIFNSTFAISQFNDVTLQDGRKIQTEINAYQTTEFHLLDPFFGLPIMPRFEKTPPDKYSLRFVNPDSKQKIAWNGKRGFTPVLLDIVDGVPYLVLLGRPTKETEDIYGCPELPYIYLKFETKDESKFYGRWIPVSSEKAPDILQTANLSSQPTNTGGGYFQKKIPKRYSEWNYSYKNSYRNERIGGDCRPKLQSPPEVELPLPKTVELNLVESSDVSIKASDDYYKLLASKIGNINTDNCNGAFRTIYRDSLLIGDFFTKDPTETKRIPYTGPAPFPSRRTLEPRAYRYCNDNFVWFVSSQEMPEKTVITKYTIAGDLVYNLAITNPSTTDNNLSKRMVLNSFSEEGGYMAFYWIQELPTDKGPPPIYWSRLTKFRFKEPM